MRCHSKIPKGPPGKSGYVKVAFKNLCILLTLLLVPLLSYNSLNYFLKTEQNKSDKNDDVLKLHARYDKNSDGFIDLRSVYIHD